MIRILSIDFTELGFVFIVRFDNLKDLMTVFPVCMRDELTVWKGKSGQVESGCSGGSHGWSERLDGRGKSLRRAAVQHESEAGNMERERRITRQKEGKGRFYLTDSNWDFSNGARQHVNW